MKNNLTISLILISCLFYSKSNGQVDDTKTGGWYMYFWNTNIKQSSFGFQGDVQYRNWNVIGDLEQLLLRGGFTYVPQKTDVKFTLGYAFILSGTFGDSKDKTPESRIYQEALLPQKVGQRVYITHRFRFEQRFIENQNFRTRLRYNLFINLPLNKTDLKKGAVYLSFYNEIFINNQRDIGDGKTVEIFDRNRTYGAIGYSISDKLKIQLGYMHQASNNLGKGQIQLSVHQKM